MKVSEMREGMFLTAGEDFVLDRRDGSKIREGDRCVVEEVKGSYEPTMTAILRFEKAVWNASFNGDRRVVFYRDDSFELRPTYRKGALFRARCAYRLTGGEGVVPKGAVCEVAGVFWEDPVLDFWQDVWYEPTEVCLGDFSQRGRRRICGSGMANQGLLEPIAEMDAKKGLSVRDLKGLPPGTALRALADYEKHNVSVKKGATCRVVGAWMDGITLDFDEDVWSQDQFVCEGTPFQGVGRKRIFYHGACEMALERVMDEKKNPWGQTLRPESMQGFIRALDDLPAAIKFVVPRSGALRDLDALRAKLAKDRIPFLTRAQICHQGDMRSKMPILVDGLSATERFKADFIAEISRVSETWQIRIVKSRWSGLFCAGVPYEEQQGFKEGELADWKGAFPLRPDVPSIGPKLRIGYILPDDEKIAEACAKAWAEIRRVYVPPPRYGPVGPRAQDKSFMEASRDPAWDALRGG